MKRIVSLTLLALLLAGTFALAFNVGLVRAQAEIIYINDDGSVSPFSAPISTLDNITYTFTGNITYPTYNGIIVERSNIVIDGNGYTVQGNQSGNGVNLTSVSNVTIEDAKIKDFIDGIYLVDSSYNTLRRNTATANGQEGIYLDSSSYNTVSGNNATANGEEGIWLWSSSYNTVSGNNATANGQEGIWLWSSSYNTVSGNNATANINGIYLDSSSNNAVNGNVATANSAAGICLYSFSNNNTVSDNTATMNGNAGIRLDSSSYNTVNGNNATANSVGIWLYSSSHNNAVSGNNSTANSYRGIYLYYSSNNTFSGNTATANSYGIYLYYSSNNNAINHNNFIGNGVQASVDSTCIGNAWDNGYPSGGNYWSDYNGTDFFSGPYQNVTGSDGIGDTPYNTDHYPLMKPYTGVHDVGITALNLSKTVVGLSYGLSVTVAVADLGDSQETFNLTVCASLFIASQNVTLSFVTSQNVTLPSENSTSITFILNTAGYPYGNYTLSAYASPVPGETNTANNNFTGGWFIVSIPGDIAGNNGLPDGKVDMRDIATVAAAFGSTPLSANWNPNADINGDGKVDMKDMALVALHFGQHYP